MNRTRNVCYFSIQYLLIDNNTMKYESRILYEFWYIHLNSIHIRHHEKLCEPRPLNIKRFKV